MHCHGSFVCSVKSRYDALCNRAVRVSAVGNFIILLLQYYAWRQTRAVSYLSGLLEIFFDLLMSIINVVVLIFARRPASHRFRFGYGKLEALGAFFQSLIVLYGCFWLVRESWESFLHPEPIYHHMLGVVLIVLSTAVTFGVAVVQRYVLSQARSLLVASDAVHVLGHLWLNLGILATIVCSYYGGPSYVDPLFGVCVACYMAYGSGRVMKQVVEHLVDAEVAPDVRAQIEKEICDHEKVRGVHQLRTRYAGVEIFVQGHLELDGDLTLRQSHDIAHEVEERILKLYPHAQVLFHQDISGEEDHAAYY